MKVIKHILTGSKTLIKGVRHCVLYVFVKALVCVFMGTVIILHTKTLSAYPLQYLL